MQFVLHELLQVTEEFKRMPKHADLDADTINAVLEEGGKFYQGKLQTARFYFAKLMPETLTLMATARTGAESLMDTEAALV